MWASFFESGPPNFGSSFDASFRNGPVPLFFTAAAEELRNRLPEFLFHFWKLEIYTSEKFDEKKKEKIERKSFNHFPSSFLEAFGEMRQKRLCKMVMTSLFNPRGSEKNARKNCEVEC